MTGDTKGIDWSVNTFASAVEYIADMIGDDFEKVINQVNRYLENPTSLNGPQAKILAARLAGYRVKIGLAKTFWQYRSSHTKNLQDRMIKDACFSLYDSLLEFINTMKIIAKQDADLV
jgi:hypothetical protein